VAGADMFRARWAGDCLRDGRTTPCGRFGVFGDVAFASNISASASVNGGDFCFCLPGVRSREGRTPFDWFGVFGDVAFASTESTTFGVFGDEIASSSANGDEFFFFLPGVLSTEDWPPVGIVDIGGDAAFAFVAVDDAAFAFVAVDDSDC